MCFWISSAGAEGVDAALGVAREGGVGRLPATGEYEDGQEDGKKDAVFHRFGKVFAQS